MSEVRDSYVEVVVDLPNGRQLRGRPIGWQVAVKLIQQYDDFLSGAPASSSAVPMLEKFLEVTGADRAAIEDLTLGEVIDAANRFFYHRRPARTAAVLPTTPAEPPATPPTPTPPAGT